MLYLFEGLKRLVRHRKNHIDNAIFRLHWQLTSIALIACCLVITSRQYVGDTIDCLQKDDMPVSTLNTYCWTHATFTIPKAFHKAVGTEVAHLGIDNSRHLESEKKYYAYYQWVCFTLFLQGVLFYLPYYLWKQWENGFMKHVSLGMQFAILPEEDRAYKKKLMIDYLYEHIGCHRWYALKYFFCELLCLLNLVFQMEFMDWFLDGEYLTFGYDVLNYLPQRHNETVVNPMKFVFPSITKCTFRKYGYSGDIEAFDALCLLPLNVFNEKIYLALWFWFVILMVITSFIILYRILIMLLPKWRANFLVTRCTFSTRRDLRIICDKGNIGDWFVLYMLGNNLDPLVLQEMTCELAKRLELDSSKLNGIHERSPMV